MVQILKPIEWFTFCTVRLPCRAVPCWRKLQIHSRGHGFPSCWHFCVWYASSINYVNTPVKPRNTEWRRKNESIESKTKLKYSFNREDAGFCCFCKLVRDSRVYSVRWSSPLDALSQLKSQSSWNRKSQRETSYRLRSEVRFSTTVLYYFFFRMQIRSHLLSLNS